MRNIYPLCLYLSLLLFSFTACTEKEDEVIPQATCNTVAEVQYVPSCGLQLVLKNGNILTPVNAKVIWADNGQAAYEINNFAVEVGQQIIIGFKPVTEAKEPSICNNSHYYNNKSVLVGCIVGLESQP